MFLRRIVSLTVLVLLSTTAVVLSDEIELGAEYKGSTSSTKTKGGEIKRDVVDLSLKSGQKLEVSVTAVTGMVIGVALVNKDGDVVGYSWQAAARKPTNESLLYGDFIRGGDDRGRGPTATLSLDKVPTTDTYKLILLSKVAGDYTLLARDPNQKAAPKVRDVEAIRKDLEAAEKRVEALKRELKEKQNGKVGK